MSTLTHFTNFDYAIIAIMVFSCVFAFFRGLVREILSLIAWIGSGIVTIYYFPSAAASLGQHFKSPAVAAGIAGIGIYLLALLCFSLINVVALKSFKSSDDGSMLDNMLGLLFGAVRGAFMVSLGFFLLTFVLPVKEYPVWLAQAVTRPYLEKGAAMLASVTPNALRNISSLQQNVEGAPNGNNASPPAPSPVVSYDANNPNNNAANAAGAASGNAGNADNNGENVGYSRSTTQQLDRLIDNTEKQ